MSQPYSPDGQYVEGEDYADVCAAGHSGTYGGLTNGFLTFVCNGGCGPQFHAKPALIAEARLGRDAAVERLEQVIAQEFRAGRPILHIAREAGMSRQAVYDLLDRRGAR